ncbi:MAG: HEAT repeat domain-containing protein, partial [Methanomicrobium sp.]|nr:HEAT repeat domain-containing protein [Methanomicrobium sp.]
NWKPKRRSHMAMFYNAKGDLNSLVKLDAEAIPVLKKEVLGSNIEKKKNIASILARINDDQASILLIKLLEDNDSQVRQKSVEAIGDRGDKRLTPYLVKALEDSDSYVRMEAAWALDKTGWRPGNPEQKSRYLIIREKWTELLQMREAALPVLIDSLKDKNHGVRLKSTEVLRAMGNIGYAAINEALKSEDKELRTGAAEAASLIKRKNSEADSKKEVKKQRTADEEVEEQIKRQKASMTAKSTVCEDKWAALMRKNGLDEERVLRFSKALSDDNEIVRAAAVESLKNAGNAGTECMIALLSDKKNNVRIAAIESLGDIKAKKAASYLVKLTKDKNENVRMASAHSLGQIGEPKTLPTIISLFSDQSPQVRKEASDSASNFGPLALSLLKNTFLEQDMTVRMTAIRSVSRINDVSSISLCVRMLNDSEYDVRDCAVKSLRILSENLFNSLIDESQRILIQGTVMEKSGMIATLSGIEDLGAKKAIYNFESDPDETIKNRARQALKGVQPENKVIPKIHTKVRPDIKQTADTSQEISPEIRKVISDLKNADNNIQMKAAEKVFIIGEDMIEPLIDSLKYDNPEYQNFAAELLTGLGDKAIKALISVLKTGKPEVKFIAAQSLGKIPEKVTIDALCEVLYKESDPAVRKVAAESLGFMGDRRSLDALIFAANEENKTVKGAAIRSLGYIEDKKAIKPLIDAFNDDDPYIIQMTTEALRNHGSDAIEALTYVLNTESNTGSRTRIAQALDELNWVPETEESISYYLIAKKQWEELEKIGEPAIKPLLEAISDDDIETRIAVVKTIANIGGKEAIAPLAKALCDKSSIVRKQAEASILAIGNQAVPVLEKIVANARDPTERTFTMSLIRKLEN